MAISRISSKCTLKVARRNLFLHTRWSSITSLSRRRHLTATTPPYKALSVATALDGDFSPFTLLLSTINAVSSLTCHRQRCLPRSRPTTAFASSFANGNSESSRHGVFKVSKRRQPQFCHSQETWFIRAKCWFLPFLRTNVLHFKRYF